MACLPGMPHVQFVGVTLCGALVSAMRAVDAMGPCPKCGEVHDPTKCPGHSKQTGKPCKNPRGKGTTHLGFGLCLNHSGSTQNGQVNAEAERRRVHLRIVESADPVFSELLALIDDKETPAHTRLLAMRDVLDRAGIGTTRSIDLDVTLNVDERRSRLAAQLEALLAGTVIDTTADDAATTGDPTTDEADAGC